MVQQQGFDLFYFLFIYLHFTSYMKVRKKSGMYKKKSCFCRRIPTLSRKWLFSFLLDGKIMKAIHHMRASRPAHILCLSVENTFYPHHYHIDQYFTHQFVKGSSALLLVMWSVYCTFHFNHLVIMRPGVLLLASPCVSLLRAKLWPVDQPV